MEQLMKWIKLVDMIEINRYDVYRKKVCHDHFDKEFSSSGTEKMKTNSYPLKLLGTNLYFFLNFFLP